MSLANPSFNYITQLRDPLIALLRANMATLNTGLNGGTFQGDGSQQIRSGFPELTPIPSSVYPVILVKWTGKDEEPLQLGRSGRKKVTAKFKLFPGVSIMDTAGDLDAEIAILCANIEGILRQNIQFTSNMLFSDIGSIDPVLMGSDSVYVHMAAIDLTCHVEII